MPEYLAPGVYVEEIDTGSKPIEGVSTSTAGLVGVTERGPVNVPILVTGYGEYQRWFGGYLAKADFPDTSPESPLRFLPHAVEGFFTNGGKRVYVVRVIEIDQAVTAETMLFDRGDAATAATRLLSPAATGATAISVLSGAGMAPDGWIQVGSGSGSEYVQVSAAPVAAKLIAIDLPLTFSYDPTAAPTTVAAFAAPTQLTLDVDVAVGDVTISVSGNHAIKNGEVLHIGDEYLVAKSEAPASPAARVVTLNAPATKAHINGANAIDVFAVPAAAGIANLTNPASAGSQIVSVDDTTKFTPLGQLVRISDGTHAEYVTFAGGLSSIPLQIEAYNDYPAGTPVQVVTMANDNAPGAKKLTQLAPLGSTILNLDNRDQLLPGDVLRIGQAADTSAEFVTVLGIPDRLPAPDAGKVQLTAPLQRDHVATVNVVRQTVTAGAGQSVVALTTLRDEAAIVAGADMGLAGTAFIRVGATDFRYHRVAAPVLVNAQVATLKTALAAPQPVGASVAVRDPLMLVRALDAGRWGNRLKVVVQDQPAPVVKSKIRKFVDSTHIKLDSASGVEAGTVLEITNAAGIVITVKVQRIERQNDSLVVLETSAAGAADGDAIRSREFQLDVLLLRQPDPAMPVRGESILDAESFRALSLDPRHSRYVHKVMGTTWAYGVAGTTDDDDNQPLRREDRRSKGESGYIRVRDLAQDIQNTAAREAELSKIRLGPDLLVDTLPSGLKRPGRQALAHGQDAEGSITDDTYKGQDSNEPADRTGLFSLRNEEEIAIVAIPGRTSAAIQGALIDHCELMRYRFAVMDGPQPPGDSLTDVQNQRQQFDTKYAALYHPWLEIPDPYPVSLVNIPTDHIAPSGHMMGIYARTDIERGVHKAPANEVVRGIVGLRRSLNKGEQDILNPYPVNINVIRDFRLDNRGIRVYGGRVITSDPDWKYVNVRRLLIFIEHSLDRGLQWVVFEPNAEPLWARVRRSISNFLTTVWRNGALEGTTKEEAFFVKCDRTTMTQTDIDNGRLIVVIGVAPVKPAEYVIVRIGLWTAHAED